MAHWNADLYDEKTNQFVFDENAAKFYQFVSDWAQWHGVNRLQKFESGFGQWGTPKLAFFAEKTAMTRMGPWMDMHIQKYAPDLEIGVTPFPAVEEKVTHAPVAYFNADVCYIPVNAKHPQEAFQFLLFLISDRGQFLLNNDGEYPDVNGRTPVLKSTFTQEFVDSSPNTFIQQHLDILNSTNMFNSPEMTIFPQYQTELGRVYEKALVLDGDAVKNLQRAIDNLNKALKRRR